MTYEAVPKKRDSLKTRNLGEPLGGELHLFVLGSANIDLTFRVPGMPRPGVTEVCPYMLGFGGKGA